MKKKIFALSIAVMLAAADTYAYKSAVGDIDNNRTVDAKDAAAVIRAVMNDKEIKPSYSFAVYDVNADGKIDILDAAAILNGNISNASYKTEVRDKERAAKMDGFAEYIFTLEDGDPSNGSAWNTENTTQFKWSYINGCMASAYLRLYEAAGGTKYKNYADNYMSGFINADGSFKDKVSNRNNVTNPTKLALDDINSGKSMLELISLDSANSGAYRAFADDTLYGGVLAGFESLRTAEGNYYHKYGYPCQVWLDGTYMALPFKLRYEYDINNGANIAAVSDDVTNQFKNIYNKMRDKTTGLYYHGYCSGNDPESGDHGKVNFKWASYNTDNPGCSQCVWLRGQAWYAMALADCIELMEDGDDRNTLIFIYKDLMDSLIRYQDDNGMWRQVIDGEKSSANYFETSGSAGIAYALMKGYNLNILPQEYYDAGLKAFNGVVDNKLAVTKNKGVTVYTLSDICKVAGLDDISRNGSYTYYTTRTEKVSNDAKGMAPLLLAYSEVLKHDTVYVEK